MIERNFYAEDYGGYKEALSSAEDWFYNETPRHRAGEVEIKARVYTDSGTCRKEFRARASYKGVKRF